MFRDGRAGWRRVPTYKDQQGNKAAPRKTSTPTGFLGIRFCRRDILLLQKPTSFPSGRGPGSLHGRAHARKFRRVASTSLTPGRVLTSPEAGRRGDAPSILRCGRHAKLGWRAHRAPRRTDFSQRINLFPGRAARQKKISPFGRPGRILPEPKSLAVDAFARQLAAGLPGRAANDVEGATKTTCALRNPKGADMPRPSVKEPMVHRPGRGGGRRTIPANPGRSGRSSICHKVFPDDESADEGPAEVGQVTGEASLH